MRIGRIAYIGTDKGILIGVVTEMSTEGLKFKTAADAEPQFAAKGEVHKVRSDFAHQVKELIGVERPKMHEGDAVLVVKDGKVLVGQLAANLKGDTASVILTKGGRAKKFPADSVTAIGDYNTEHIVQNTVGFGQESHGEETFEGEGDATEPVYDEYDDEEEEDNI